MTDKNFNPIENAFISFAPLMVIPVNNSISGINKQTFQETIMIKIKCGFVSANKFYFDDTSSYFATVPIVDYSVTAASGNLKNDVKVTIEFDNNGSTSWSNGVKYARRVKVYGYSCK